MEVIEFFNVLQSATNLVDAEKAIKEFERDRVDIEWVPVGNRENNRGTIEVSADPGRSLVERITNGIDAILESEYESHNGLPICRNPKEAASAWLNIPPHGLSEMTPSQRKPLAQKVVVRILPGDNRNARIVEIRDFGVGLTPYQMPNTILSLNEGNKLKKHYLVGLFGQGGSSTLAVSKITMITSRYANDQNLGFTIVRYLDLPPDEYKTGHYVYMTLKGEVLEISSENKEFQKGTQVKHFGYDLTSYSGPVGPNSVYGLLNSVLFDPVLPIWLDNQVHNYRRVIKGSRNALNGAVDEGDDEKHGPDIAHSMKMFYVDLGDWGRIGVEYWVLGKPEKENRKPSAAYVNPNKPIVLTLNGQSHAEFPKNVVKKDADLPYLASRFIGHIDCNSLAPHAKRALFVSNREDARSGEVLDLIEGEFTKALKSDDELIRLNIEARTQNLQERDQSAIQQMRTEVANILRVQGFEATSAVGGLTLGGTGINGVITRPRRSKRTFTPLEIHDPPTFIRIVWKEGEEIPFYPGQRRYIRIQTDANSTYHNPNDPTLSRINFIVTRETKYCGSTPLQGGRLRAILESKGDITIGERGKIRVELNRPGLPMIFDERSIAIVEKPPVEPTNKRLTLPPFDIKPISPADEMWYTLEWPDSPYSNASSAEKEEDGVLRIYYSTVFPKYVDIRTKLEQRDLNLANSFTKRYEIWIIAHSLLMQRDKELAENSPSGLFGLEANDQLVEEFERKERCRIATICAIIAEKEIQQQESPNVSE